MYFKVQFSQGGAVMTARKAFKKDDFLRKPEIKAMQEEHKKVYM
jgi:hypothetical protein